MSTCSPEHVADFIEATGPNHAGAVAEPGCLRFDVLQAPDDPTRFVLYEAYRDAAAAAAHKETDHYRAWKTAVASWMAEPRRGEPVHRPPAGPPVSGPGPLGAFGVARLPRIVFGAGRITELPAIAPATGRTRAPGDGSRSFRDGPAWAPLVAGLEAAGLAWDHLGRRGRAVTGPRRRRRRATGAATRRTSWSGSAAGRPSTRRRRSPGSCEPARRCSTTSRASGAASPTPGPATPFVAVPTTAGTGSEATRNAVISGRLPDAGADDPPFKKSFRDDRLVASVALLDPDLLAGCPPAVIAGDGMDALTQLLESFTSTGASPFTDAVARSGLAAIGDRAAGLARGRARRAPRPAETAAARGAMAWAALCSGIALANAGLGAVHGLVAPLGARFGIHHGTGCGALVAAVTRTNLAALAERAPGSPALDRYAEAGRLLAGRRRRPAGDRERRRAHRRSRTRRAASRPWTGSRPCSGSLGWRRTG